MDLLILLHQRLQIHQQALSDIGIGGYLPFKADHVRPIAADDLCVQPQLGLLPIKGHALAVILQMHLIGFTLGVEGSHRF